MNPKVSVICIKNDKNCIESILNQTLKEIEVLLNNRCNIEDERIKYNSEPKGKFVLVTDGNCTFEFNMLSTMVEVMEKSNAGLGICGVNKNGTKRASCMMRADTDNRKFLAMKELAKDDMFCTFNNSLMKNMGTINDKASFYENFKLLYLNSVCDIFSNAFVVESDVDKEIAEFVNIEEFVRYFLRKGAKNNA